MRIHKWNYSPSLQTRYVARQQSSPVCSGFSWSQKAWQQKSSKRTSQKLPAFDATYSAIRGKNPSNFKRCSKAWAGNHSKPLHRLHYYNKRMKDPPSPREETWKPPFQHRSPHNEAEVSKAAPITLSKVSLYQSILVRRRFAFQSASFRLFLIPVVTPWKLARYL